MNMLTNLIEKLTNLMIKLTNLMNTLTNLTKVLTNLTNKPANVSKHVFSHLAFEIARVSFIFQMEASRQTEEINNKDRGERRAQHRVDVLTTQDVRSNPVEEFFTATEQACRFLPINKTEQIRYIRWQLS